jgi:hypothetical protein
MKWLAILVLSIAMTLIIADARAQMPPPQFDDVRFPDEQSLIGPGRDGFGPPPRYGPPRFGGRSNFRRPTAQAATQQPDERVLSALNPTEKKATFSNNVKVSLTGQFLDVASNGIPNHPTGNYPNEHNPNSILRQDYHFRIPLKPKMARDTTSLPFGPIGVAVNGIPFYNPYNAQGMDAVFGPNAEVFDSCCGHPDPMGRYHYHKYPICVNSPFRDPYGKHSTLIGWAFDGFAIYGPNGEDGEPPKDLDGCNGHTDKARGYHYHVTSGFPYVLGAYRGVVEMSNFEGPVWGR